MSIQLLFFQFFPCYCCSIIWKSDLTDKVKSSVFQAVVVSILLYGCTTWTLTKRLEKKLDGNYTRMLRAILNKSWQQHPIKHQLYGHLLPIRKTIQGRRTRHAGHCWRSRDELISDVLLWTPTYGRVKAGRPATTYIQQLCEDTGCSPEDLPEAMIDREKWCEGVRDIRTYGTMMMMIVVQLIFVLFMLFLVAVISKALCIIMSFLILRSISGCTSLVNFKNGPEYFTSGTAKMFYPLMRFLQYSLFSRSFLVLLRYF